MKTGKSEIVIVLDRSGSMASIKKDMEGGLKSFLDVQKANPGEPFVTLYKFDTVSEKEYELKSLKDIDGISIEPRGGTALIDTLCKSIDEVGIRLAKTPDNEKPQAVLFVVITDGEENSSRIFNNSNLKDRIEHQQNIYNWKFMFLGANQDAIANGTKMGFKSADSIGYVPNFGGINNVFEAAARKAYSYTSQVNAPSYNFSPEERSKAKDE